MKVVRYILMVLIGGMIGGVIGGVFGATNNFQFIKDIEVTDPQTLTTIGVIGLVIIVALIIVQVVLQNKVIKLKKAIDNEQADDMDGAERKASQQLVNVSLLLYTEYVVSFVIMLIYTIINNDTGYIWYPVGAFLLCSIGSIIYGFFVRKYDHRFPKLGEKDYVEKTLAIMDEGERHITLKSMYKIFIYNISILPLAIMILGIYSIGSGENQFLGITILIILFIYNAYGYHFKVRQYYK